MSKTQKVTETAASQEAIVVLERIEPTMAIGETSSMETDTESLLGTPRRRSARLRSLSASVNIALPLTPRRSRRKSSDSASCSQSSSRAECEETKILSAITEEEPCSRPKRIEIAKSPDSTNSPETATGAATMLKGETEKSFAGSTAAALETADTDKNDLEEVSNDSEEIQEELQPAPAAAQKSQDEMKTIRDVVTAEVEVSSHRAELLSGPSTSDTTEAEEETQIKVSSDSDVENESGQPPPSDASHLAERNTETVANARERMPLDGEQKREQKEERFGKGGNEAGNSAKVELNKCLGKSDHELAMSLGRKKSGKVWKSDRDRFRSVVKTKGLKQVKEAQKRIAAKKELLRVREFERSLREEKKRKLDEIRSRQEENKRRRTENQLKSEVVERITNPNKIKRMKKKQLRMLAKRDTTRVEKS